MFPHGTRRPLLATLSAASVLTFALAQRSPTDGSIDESDLSRARYATQERSGSHEARFDWGVGTLTFSATKYSHNPYDEEGLKTAARDYAYLKAREFLEGVTVGGARTYERRDVQTVSESNVTDKTAERTTHLLTVSVSEGSVRGTIVSETFELVADPLHHDAKIAKATATIAVSLFDRDRPERAVLPSMVAAVREAEQRAGFVAISSPARVADSAIVTSPNSAPATSEVQPESKPPVVTGLIVDTRGLRMRPVQVPALTLDGSDQQLVFGALRNLNPDFIARFGVAGWARQHGRGATTSHTRWRAPDGSEGAPPKLQPSRSGRAGCYRIGPHPRRRLRIRLPQRMSRRLRDRLITDDSVPSVPDRRASGCNRRDFLGAGARTGSPLKVGR